MERCNDKKRDLPSKPEWKILLDFMLFSDQSQLYQVCRKMIIHLDKLKIKELYELLEELNPSYDYQESLQKYGPNWPKPKGSPFIAGEIIDKVFCIADKHLTDIEITELLTGWIQNERLGALSQVLEKRHAPLSEVVEALQKYFRLGGSQEFTTVNERIGVRVSLIFRFLSENLTYINIAKEYITLLAIESLLDRIIGPAYGNGKLGGKSAGLILAYQIIKYKAKLNPILNEIYTPKSWMVTSDGLLEFVHYNALDEFVFTKYKSSNYIAQEYSFLEYIFKSSYFPPESLYAFNAVLDDLEGCPIVVRSSSLLEDSFEASFSGKYKSLFLSNIGTKSERLSALMNAIAEVYASTFGPDPIQYRKERGLIDFREEMGILIQEVVGNKLGKYFLPSYAGVAFSHNEFRWSTRIKREDGIVRLVAGLGTRAVDRTNNDYPTLVSPGKPGLKVNTQVIDQIRYSQQYVDVINLKTNNFETVKFDDIIDECRGNLPGLDKIVSFNRQGMLVDPISAIVDFLKEDLVVTFNALIEKTNFVKKMNVILNELKESFKSPVDLEFASDGKKLYLLQCRPQSQFLKDSIVNIPINIPEKDKIFTANQYVSNGLVEDIEFVVYVDSFEYSELITKQDLENIGRLVSKLNEILPNRKFILIGPGRWGSKGDIKLGVPVIYSDINNTAMLIEVAREKAGYVPELSFGTHFFQDLVESNIKYLPLYPDNDNNYFDEDFFDYKRSCLSEFIEDVEKYHKVIRLLRVSDYRENATLSVYMSGESNEAVSLLKNVEKD